MGRTAERRHWKDKILYSVMKVGMDFTSIVGRASKIEDPDGGTTGTDTTPRDEGNFSLIV